MQRKLNDEALDCIVTSINDSKHSRKSKHHIGMAFDLRSRHMTDEDKGDILATMKRSLPGFDVLLEGLGTPNEHFHIEYDPSR